MVVALSRCRDWWATTHSSIITHRRLKWAWVFPGIPISFVLRESVPYLVFLSVYAIITGHWSAEEGAISAKKSEDE